MFAGTLHNGSEHTSQGPAPTGARSALRPAASAVGLGANRSSYVGQCLPMFAGASDSPLRDVFPLPTAVHEAF